MFNMFGKLQEMQQKMAEVRNRLENISVYGSSASGKVNVEVSANRRVKNIDINPELLSNKEELQDHLEIALNQALEQADKIAESEMKAVTNELLPGGLGALGNLFGK